MADAALSKSLDDLIKEQKQQQRGKQAPKKKVTKAPIIKDKPMAEAGGSGKKRNGVGRRKSGGGGATTVAPRTLQVTVKVKREQMKHRAPVAPRLRDPERVNPDLRRSRLDGDARWQHDMAGQAKGRERNPRAPPPVGTKLYVTNLDYKVSSDDVRELFETVGPLIAARVHFVEHTGRSKGTGEVIFTERDHAAAAQEQYHGVELDGRPMNIELIETKQPDARTLKSGIRITGGPGRTVTVPTMMTTAVRQAQQSTMAQPPRGRGGNRAGFVKSRVEMMQM